MKLSRPVRLQAVIERLRDGEGHASRELRADVAAFVAALVEGRDEDGKDLPEQLRVYLRKLATHAYRITDDDIAALKGAGYSEDQIFELTASGALSAGITQMDRGLAALAAAGPAGAPARGAR